MSCMCALEGFEVVAGAAYYVSQSVANNGARRTPNLKPCCCCCKNLKTLQPPGKAHKSSVSFGGTMVPNIE